MVRYFHSGAMPVLNVGHIKEVIAQSHAKILESLEAFTENGSGWTLKRCIALDLGITKYQPFRARSYFKTPKYIPPRTVVNVQNEDNRCFEWTILSALYPAVKDPQRPSKYRVHLGKLNFTGIEFPVKASDISKFGLQNRGLSVCLFGWNKGLYPIYESKQVGYKIDLLLLNDLEDPEKTSAACFSRTADMSIKSIHAADACTSSREPNYSTTIKKTARASAISLKG